MGLWIEGKRGEVFGLIKREFLIFSLIDLISLNKVNGYVQILVVFVGDGV